MVYLGSMVTFAFYTRTHRVKLGNFFEFFKKICFPDVTNAVCTGFIVIRAHTAETGIGDAVGSGA